MPIYEYQCTECEHQLEAIQKISDKPLVECPACGKPGLKKLVSAAAFHLKGTGWYETDFKGKSKAKDDNKTSDDTSKKDDAGKSKDTTSKDTSVKSTTTKASSTTSS